MPDFPILGVFILVFIGLLTPWFMWCCLMLCVCVCVVLIRTHHNEYEEKGSCINDMRTYTHNKTPAIEFIKIQYPFAMAENAKKRFLSISDKHHCSTLQLLCYNCSNPMYSDYIVCSLFVFLPSLNTHHRCYSLVLFAQFALLKTRTLSLLLFFHVSLLLWVSVNFIYLYFTHHPHSF